MPAYKPASAGLAVNNLELMRTWLQVCCKGHPKCSYQPSTFLPTRLIDVQARDIGSDVKLIHTKSMGTSNVPTYLTLSHCWGPKRTHSKTTAKNNLEQRMSSIPFIELSKTFQDAVRITRELGQRYLWIDSLCIIQDDGEDWEKEAALMSEVYGNALCTLAALSSQDGTEGCNLVTDIQRSTKNTFIDLDWNGHDAYPRIRVFEREPKYWQVEYDGVSDDNGTTTSPLRHRAWVLQERELSRRSIHFGKDQLLWECKGHKFTAQMPWKEWKREEDILAKRDWYELIEDYTLRSITKVSDKLPAFSGIAKRRQNNHNQYLAGIWSSHFPGALLWQSTNPEAKRLDKVDPDVKYIAPSWSWASIQGEVTYVSTL